MTNLLKAIVYLESGHHTFRGNSIGIISKTTQLTGKAKKDWGSNTENKDKLAITAN